MGAWRFLCAIAVLVAVAMAGIGSAGAAEMGWPLDGPAEALLGFGDTYTAEEGSTLTHRGIDLAAAPGERVGAVLGGTVSFAGRVPAGVGATTLAVTVQSGDLRITLMPLSELAVRAGDSVEPGTALGVLAATGDRSQSESHLHVGVRREELYIDPSAFLAPPVVGGEPADADVTVPAEVAAPSLASASAPVARTPVPAVAHAQASVTAGAGASVAARAPSGARTGQSVPSPKVSRAGQTAGSSVVSPEPATAAGMNAGQVAADGSTEDARPSSMPTYLSGAVRSLHLDEERVGAALTADRRSQLLASRSPNLRAIVLGVAAVAGAALLWPLWRSVPVQGLAVVARRDDVAAVVSR